MNTPRTRRVTVAVLLAASGLFLLPYPAYAGCMADEKGNQVCGDNGAGPTSGPGSYSGVSGVNNGSAGDIGPDGQPMTGATQPVFGPGAAPAPVNAAPNPGGPAVYEAPPATVPQTNEQLNGRGYQPAAQDVPDAPANTTAQVSAEDAGTTDVAPPSASSAATAVPTASAAPSPTATMTARPTRPATQTKSAPAEAIAAAPASEAEQFNPLPLIMTFGGLIAAAGLIWFIPGARAAVVSVFTRAGGH